MKALFEIGQKVVCVDSKGHNTELIEGKTYTIRGIKRRDCCGVFVVDVGVFGNYKRGRCACGCCFKYDGYKNQTRFVPLDFDRQADEEIHQALKGIRIEN